MKLKIVLYLCLIYGLLMFGSLIVLAVFDMRWWVPIPRGDGREIGIAFLHVLGMVLGIVGFINLSED